MDTVICPYCEEECEINHDDGAFYKEDELEEMECSHCEKTFLVRTNITYYYEGEKCPCKNGEEHDWKDSRGYPKEHFIGKQRCSYCDEERDTLSAEERKKTMDDYFKKLEQK